MTGAVTTKYENQHPVKVQTSSFSYKFTCSGTEIKDSLCIIIRNQLGMG